MPSTYSPALRLELIGNGEQAGNWGNTTNTNLGTLLEQAITGVSSIPMLDANYTLVSGNGISDEARNAVLVMTGTLTVARSVIVPTSNKFYAVRNATTGNQSIVVRTAAGTGVTLANGFTQLMYCDGTNVVLASVPIDAANGNISTGGSITATGGFVGNLTGTATTANNVSGVVAVANGGTGATTQSSARSNLGATTTGDAVFTAANPAAARSAILAAGSGAVGSSGLTMNTARLLGRTTAASGAVEEISVGSGLSLASGSLSVNPAGVSGLLLNVQVFTSSGTYTRTANVTRAVVVAVGGGGGGSGRQAFLGPPVVVAGSSGGTTFFGSHVSAAGGAGAPANNYVPGGAGGTGGSSATIAIRGAPGLSPASLQTTISGAGGGQGGGSSAIFPGFAVQTNGNDGVRGGGGSGAIAAALSGCCVVPVTGAGGGQGETAIKYIQSGLGATEAVTIGGGGSGGASSANGGSGGAGYVIVYEYS